MGEYYLQQKHMNIGADSGTMITFFALKMIGSEGSFLSCPPHETKSRNTQDYKYSPLRMAPSSQDIDEYKGDIQVKESELS